MTFFIKQPLFSSFWILSIFGWMGCTTETFDTYEDCVLDVSISPIEGRVGDTILATGTPFSEPYDTNIVFAGLDSEILQFDRQDCAQCELCQASELCDLCDTCAPCETACSTCVETMEFLVPASPEGPTTVQIWNRFGQSAPLQFEVLPPEEKDTGSNDTGSKDTGSNDTGSKDTGSKDTGSKDTGSDDSNAEDTSLVDTSNSDTGGDDSGVGDATIVENEDGPWWALSTLFGF